MKHREDLDAIRYLTDVLHDAHDGPVPTFAREREEGREGEGAREKARPKRSWLAVLWEGWASGSGTS